MESESEMLQLSEDSGSDFSGENAGSSSRVFIFIPLLTFNSETELHLFAILGWDGILNTFQ